MRARIVGLAAWYSKLLRESLTPEEVGRSLVKKCLLPMDIKAVPNRRTEPGCVKIVVHPSTFQKLELARQIPFSFKSLFQDPDETTTKKFSDLVFLLAVLEHGGLLAGIKLESNEGRALLKKVFGGYEVDNAEADFKIDSELDKIESLILQLKKNSGKGFVNDKEEEAEEGDGEEAEEGDGEEADEEGQDA